MNARQILHSQDRNKFSCHGQRGRRRGHVCAVNRVPTPSRGHGTQVCRCQLLLMAAASHFKSNDTYFSVIGVAAFNYPSKAERNCYLNP